MFAQMLRWLIARIPDPLRGDMPRWALAPFAAFAWHQAYWYISADPQRWSSPYFGAALYLGRGSMVPWGIAWALVAVVITVGLLLRRPPFRFRWVTLTGLLLGMGMATWWASIGAIQAAVEPLASPTGGGVFGFIAFCYFLAAARVASATVRRQ